MDARSEHRIETAEQLEALYEKGPTEKVMAAQTDHLPAGYRVMVEAATMVIVSTVGPDGLDTSPRGGKPGFVKVIDDKTLHLPDYKGNNRLDSMHNLLVDPRISMLFLIPGLFETLRVTGRATISIDPQKLAQLQDRPLSLLEIRVESAFFQCSKAPIRSGLWGGPTDPGEKKGIRHQLDLQIGALRKQRGLL